MSQTSRREKMRAEYRSWPWLEENPYASQNQQAVMEVLVGYLTWFLVMTWLLRTSFAPAQPGEVSYSDFLAELKVRHLEDVRITERQLIGTLKKDQVKKNDKNAPANNQTSCTKIPGLDGPEQAVRA
jgi:hypothetical protein